MVEILHDFHSDKTDGTDATLVKPSDWNDPHKIEVDAPSVLGALVAGPVIELPLVTSPPSDPGQIWTKKAIEAAIASAIATAPSALPVGCTIGWYTNTLPSGRWLFCNGMTIGSGTSGATARANADVQALFLYLWTLPNAFCPVTPSRGTSASGDWTANKRIGLPDERGRVSAGADNMGGAAAAGILNATGFGVSAAIGAVGGFQTHTLTTAQIPAHKHSLVNTTTWPDGGALGYKMGGSGGFALSDFAGGTIKETLTNTGGGGVHPIVQPTIIRNVLIRY